MKKIYAVISVMALALLVSRCSSGSYSYTSSSSVSSSSSQWETVVESEAPKEKTQADYAGLYVSKSSAYVMKEDGTCICMMSLLIPFSGMEELNAVELDWTIEDGYAVIEESDDVKYQMSGTAMIEIKNDRPSGVRYNKITTDSSFSTPDEVREAVLDTVGMETVEWFDHDTNEKIVLNGMQFEIPDYWIGSDDNDAYAIEYTADLSTIAMVEYVASDALTENVFRTKWKSALGDKAGRVGVVDEQVSNGNIVLIADYEDLVDGQTRLYRIASVRDKNTGKLVTFQYTQYGNVLYCYIDDFMNVVYSGKASDTY